MKPSEPANLALPFTVWRCVGIGGVERMPLKAMSSRNRVTPFPSSALLAFVVLLILLGGPAAIPWRVRAIVINPLDGHSHRARPHVLIKSEEAILPTVADGNSAATVIHVAWVFGVVAALF